MQEVDIFADVCTPGYSGSRLEMMVVRDSNLWLKPGGKLGLRHSLAGSLLLLPRASNRNWPETPASAALRRHRSTCNRYNHPQE